METLKNNKTIIIVVIIVILGLLAYRVFSSGTKEEELISSAGSSEILIGKNLLDELNRLKSLRNINDSLFADSVFLQLRDLSVPVTSQPLGRENPFAPTGSI